MAPCWSVVSAAKSRSISLPLDLEAQISSMLSTSALNSLSRSNPNYRSSSRSSRPAAPINPWDYKNIIEKLQVPGSLCGGAEPTLICLLLRRNHESQAAFVIVCSLRPPGHH